MNVGYEANDSSSKLPSSVYRSYFISHSKVLRVILLKETIRLQPVLPNALTAIKGGGRPTRLKTHAKMLLIPI